MPPFVDVVPLGTPANVFLKCYLRGIQGVGVGWGQKVFTCVPNASPDPIQIIFVLQSSEAGAPFLWPYALPFFRCCG